MSQSLHVCKICGKWFATAQAVCGHQRVHSELKRVWGLKKPPRVCSVSTSIESKAPFDPSLQESSSSFMSEIEKHEMDDAAMSLVMLSERVSLIRNLPPGDFAVRCVDQSKQELSEVSATCSDVVAQALPSPLRSKLLGKREGNFSYRFKICGKSFERSLGVQQALHRSKRKQLECKKEESEVDGSLCDVLADSGAKKIVTQPSSCFGVSQEELVERGDTNVKEHSFEAFSKVSSHYKRSGSYSDVVIAQEALLIPLGSRLQEKSQSKYSSCKCKVCGKSFGCFQALGGHQTLHRRKRKKFEDGNSPPSGSSSQAKKIVPQPSSFEVPQEELVERGDTNVEELCVELRQDFEMFDTCSDVLVQALSSPLRCNMQKGLQSNSSYERVLKML